MNKQKKEKEMNVDVLLASDASNAQGWIVNGGDCKGYKLSVVGCICTCTLSYN